MIDTSRSAMTLGQLRIHATELGLTKLHAMTRADLVEAIRAAEDRRLKARANQRHAAAIAAMTQGGAK